MVICYQRLWGPSQLWHLIGKGGETIEALQQNTGAMMDCIEQFQKASQATSDCILAGLGQILPAVPRYCARLQQPSFWGGEVEILVLSRMLKVPIYVYKSAQEAGR